MAITRVEKRVTKTNRHGDVVKNKTTVKETSTLGKVVKIGLITGLAVVVLGALCRDR